MTREDLRGIVEGITDEQLKKILDIHSADIGKAKNGQDALQAELEAAKVRSEEMEQEISLLKSGQCEADEMKIKIEELQKVIDQSAQAEKQRLAENEFSRRFDEVSGGRAFVNELTRNGIYQEFKAQAQNEQNAKKSDAELYEGLISSRENLFAPSTGIPSIIGSAMGFGEDLNDGDVREIMGLH